MATKSSIETSFGFTRLVVETMESYGVRCSECEGVGKNGKLKVYATVYGANRRTHNGQFCSKKCHDIFHGLRPRRS